MNDSTVSSSQVESEGKKRPLSLLEGASPLEDGTSKKPRELESTFDDRIVKQEELSSDVPSLGGGPIRVISGAMGRSIGFGGTGEESLSPSDGMVATSVAVKSEPGVDDASGIFDDADEDESFDLATLKNLSPPPAPKASASLRPDLVAAILGSPPKKFGAPTPFVAPPPEKPEPKKRKFQTKKVLKAKKEMEAATRLLNGKIDLTKVLPEAHCSFLAKNFWIFTVQQLEAVLKATEGTGLNIRQEIIATLINSDLLVNQADTCQPLMTSTTETFSETQATSAHIDPNIQEDNLEPSHDTNQVSVKIEDTNDSADQGDSQSSEKSRQDKVVAPKSSTIKLEPDCLTTEAAEKLMQSWSQMVGKYHPPAQADGLLNFPLDGPISCLIPTCTQNFLKSAGILSAGEFLSLKKTESGLVVDIYASWRKKCGMEEIPCVTIAKHLMGIGTRFEIALDSVLADKEVREWVGGNAIVLSGQGKDFLFDHCKLYNADAFLERRTKELADRLKDWRDARGLPPLKGTGKVAMISAWKTLVKEAKELELQDGYVLTTEDLMAEVEGESSPQAVSSRNAAKTIRTVVENKTGSKHSEIRQTKIPQELSQEEKRTVPPTHAQLDSQELLSEVLNKEIVSMLAANGISTAKQLLEAGKNADPQLISAVMKMRKDFSGGSGTSDDSTGCIRLVDEWCQQVSGKLGVVEVSAPQTPEKQIVANRQRPTDRVSLEKTISDPWDALSQASKDFLKSIDIKDAESFLAAKTKHLADAFAKYREERGMAPLKGLGSVASISGWKAIVRKAAKDAGQDRLVTLNAGRNAGIKLNRRPKEETNESTSSQPLDVIPTKQPDLPSNENPSSSREGGSHTGSSKNIFWVTNDTDAFCFDVTQRRSTDESSKLSWYLSYLGSRGVQASGSSPTRVFASLPNEESITTLKVMNDAEGMGNDEALDNRSFKSQERGLVELSKYGISPRPLNGDLAWLKAMLKSFIFQKNNQSSHNSRTPYNVFERWVNGKKELYFYMACPFEVGQTVELRFLPLIAQDQRGDDCDDWTRICIREEIDALNMKDLKNLLSFLDEEVEGLVHHKAIRGLDTLGVEVKMYDKHLTEAIIARRRMHWSAQKIKSALQKESEPDIPSSASKPLWSSDFVKRICRHGDWEKKLCPLLQTECKKEIMAEIQSTPWADFWMTKENWCAMANALAEQTMEIFSSYNAELDKVSTEQQIVDELCSMVTRAVSQLKEVEGGALDGGALSRLLMRVTGHHPSPSNIFPSLAFFRGKLTQAYTDCMALCDEPVFDVPTNGEERFIATAVATSKKRGSTEFESLDHFHSTKATIDVSWYVGVQVVAVVETVALSGVATLSLPDPTKLNDISTIIRECAKSALGSSAMIPPMFGSYANKKIQKSMIIPEALLTSTVKTHCKPDSAPIFLVTVWPILKAWKWRMEAGSTPSSVTFYSPGRKKDKRTRHLKYEAAMQRLKIARKTAELGLGYIPKQAKRLFISCGSIDENNDEAPTVSAALLAFKKSLADTGLSDVAEYMEKIVESLANLFESIGPYSLYETEAKDVELPEGSTWNESLSCDYLMRFLLVLPKMLRHSDLSTQQADSASGVVAELVGFLVDNRRALFGASLQPPREEYETDYQFPTFIVPHLETTQAKSVDNRLSLEKQAVPSSLKEVILPSDRDELTDFVTTVLDQLIICRASTDDLRRKGRRAFLALGCPGLMCRHCLGQYGEGKYFYSNIQSLSTAPTSIDKHIARCPKISNEVKEKMAAARATHPEQKASTPSGAQSAFFSRLWDRLQLSRTFAGAEGDMYVSFNDLSGEGEQDKETQQTSAGSQSGIEFRSHIEILTYIQTTAPWKNNVEVLNALEKYYSCLSFGGAIFNTAAMPPHYSSEWVLAKHHKGTLVSEQAGDKS